jgi:hypothetical protein
MGKVFYIIVLVLFFVSLTSCTNDYKIQKMEDKIIEVEKNINKLKEADWEQLEIEMNEFEIFVEENKSDFSSGKRTLANELIGRYNKLIIEKKINDVNSEVKDFKEKIEALIN